MLGANARGLNKTRKRPYSRKTTSQLQTVSKADVR